MNIGSTNPFFCQDWSTRRRLVVSLYVFFFQPHEKVTWAVEVEATRNFFFILPWSWLKYLPECSLQTHTLHSRGKQKQVLYSRTYMCKDWCFLTTAFCSNLFPIVAHNITLWDSICNSYRSLGWSKASEHKRWGWPQSMPWLREDCEDLPWIHSMCLPRCRKDLPWMYRRCRP